MENMNLGGMPTSSGPASPTPVQPSVQPPVQPPVQPQSPSPVQPQSPFSANKWPWYVVAVVVIIIIAFGIWWWLRGPVPETPSGALGDVPVAPAPAPVAPPAPTPDTTGAIMNDLNQIDVGATDFQAIDQDLNQL